MLRAKIRNDVPYTTVATANYLQCGMLLGSSLSEKRFYYCSVASRSFLDQVYVEWKLMACMRTHLSSAAEFLRKGLDDETRDEAHAAARSQNICSRRVALQPLQLPEAELHALAKLAQLFLSYVSQERAEMR